MRRGGISRSLVAHVSEALGFPGALPLENTPLVEAADRPAALRFPGHDVFSVVEELEVLSRQQRDIEVMSGKQKEEEAGRYFFVFL